ILAARPDTPSKEGALRFFDAATGQELRSPAPMKIRTTCLAFHPSKLLLAVGTGLGFNAQLELIAPGTGKSLWAVPRVHNYSIDGLAFSPSGDIIATFGRTTDAKAYCVKLFDTARGTLLHDFGATQKGIASSVIFSGDGKLLAAYFGDLN